MVALTADQYGAGSDSGAECRHVHVRAHIGSDWFSHSDGAWPAVMQP